MSFQVRADDLLDHWGLRAPAPVLGESALNYRRRIMQMISNRLPGTSQLNSQLREIDYGRCDDATLTALEPELFSAAKAAVYDPSWMDEGGFREVIERDSNGLAIQKFIGRDSFVKFPEYGARPGRRVIRINRHPTQALHESHDERARRAIQRGF
jgi:hypothetical protein